MNIFVSRRRQGKGVTLLELVVSVLILGILLSALLGAFVIARVSTAKAKHHLEAANHARAAIERYIHDGTDEYEIISGDIAHENMEANCSVAVSSYATGIEKVTVTISWKERLMGSSGEETVTEQLITLVETTGAGDGDGEGEGEEEEEEEIEEIEHEEVEID